MWGFSFPLQREVESCPCRGAVYLLPALETGHHGLSGAPLFLPPAPTFTGLDYPDSSLAAPVPSFEPWILRIVLSLILLLRLHLQVGATAAKGPVPTTLARQRLFSLAGISPRPPWAISPARRGSFL